jgi:hypothetical protein
VSQDQSKEFAWGCSDIAEVIGEPVRATYHKLEKGVIPGARKVGGTWCLNVPIFPKSFEQNGAA